MRKEVKPAVKCSSCGQITEQSVVQEFCDQCGKLLAENMYALDVDISFSLGEHSDRVSLCSWKCVRTYLIANKKKCDDAWYVALPMPIFRDNDESKQHCDSGANFFRDFLQNGGAREVSHGQR